MNGELSGGKNGIVYERVETLQSSKTMQIKKPLPMDFGSGDIAFAFGMLVCGFLYWNLISFNSLGLGVTIFTLILCAATALYIHFSGLKQTKGSLFLMGVILISAVNFTLFDAQLVKGLNFIFLSACFVYWVCLSAGNRIDNRISLYLLGDALNQFIVIPLSNFSCCFSGMKQLLIKTRKGKGVLSGLIGILFFLPVLILVTSLLTDADAAFEGLMNRIQFSFSQNMIDYIWQMVLGLPVACYLFGSIYGNRYRRNTNHVTLESVDKATSDFRILPDVTVYSALTALNLIYVVYFLAQTTYFFSAFSDALPQSMTYAEYARRGFFELCAVSGINLGVIAAAHLLSKREKIKILHGETAAICIFTLALIATALSKMGMYINYYGLTQLRVYTCWFMVVLFMVFVLILLRQFIHFRGTRIAIAGFLCMFMLLSYGNVDGRIAKYNIERYQAGTLATLDIDALSDLSDAAVPYLYELFKQIDDIRLRAELRSAINQWEWDKREFEGQESFRNFNLQTYKADQLREIV